jgi:hypothetical protein
MLDRLLGADRLLAEDRALAGSNQSAREAVLGVAECERGGQEPLDVSERPQRQQPLALGTDEFLR